MDGNYHPDPASPVPLSDWTFSFWSQGTGTPVDNGTDGQLYIDTSTGDIYVYENNSWTVLSGGGGGGASEITTGASDPVGAPAAGIIFFARTDVVRVLQWNGTAWVVIVSEI